MYQYFQSLNVLLRTQIRIGEKIREDLLSSYLGKIAKF